MDLEVIAFDLASCVIAESDDANRIEMCANPVEGGTTPSLGVIAAAREITSIQLFPIIGPRGSDFLYSERELRAMAADVEVCRQLGCDGVVIGMLMEDGGVDLDRCAELIRHADSMQVSGQRDSVSIDPDEASELRRILDEFRSG